MRIRHVGRGGLHARKRLLPRTQPGGGPISDASPISDTSLRNYEKPRSAATAPAVVVRPSSQSCHNNHGFRPSHFVQGTFSANISHPQFNKFLFFYFQIPLCEPINVGKRKEHEQLLNWKHTLPAYSHIHWGASVHTAILRMRGSGFPLKSCELSSRASSPGGPSSLQSAVTHCICRTFLPNHSTLSGYSHLNSP